VLFEHHCASCHGLDAGGSGPAATALNPPPPDLTRIAARRGGQFPALEIAAIIDGRRALIAHGSRAMPVWGERYGAGQEPGPMREEQVTGNLLALVDYLESLQKP
jgi:mono/diheme cytochrome c family protein